MYFRKKSTNSSLSSNEKNSRKRGIITDTDASSFNAGDLANFRIPKKRRLNGKDESFRLFLTSNVKKLSIKN